MYLYDAILVLGAVMEWDIKRKRWNFPTIIERYPGKLVMGKARALAASLIHEQAPLLLVTGGSDLNPETGFRDSRSIYLADWIVSRHQVPSQKVWAIGRDETGHTLGNVENLIDHLDTYPEIIKTKRVAILCPRFQYERARLMFEMNPYFAEHKITLNWVIVEHVLAQKHELGTMWVNAIYATLAAEICQEMEAKGLADLKAGKYRPA